MIIGSLAVVCFLVDLHRRDQAILSALNEARQDVLKDLESTRVQFHTKLCDACREIDDKLQEAHRQLLALTEHTTVLGSKA
jgi:predicted anti-sigma-YlaC factor YlaD